MCHKWGTVILFMLLPLPFTFEKSHQLAAVQWIRPTAMLVSSVPLGKLYVTIFPLATLLWCSYFDSVSKSPTTVTGYTTGGLEFGKIWVRVIIFICLWKFTFHWSTVIITAVSTGIKNIYIYIWLTTAYS
jgi:hypothetical protein